MHRHPYIFSEHATVEIIEAPEDDDIIADSPAPEPLFRQFIADNGMPILEALLYTGWVLAPHEKGEVLELYGIDLRQARWSPQSERWEQCLFSEETVRMLESLKSEGEFPFAFEATLSEGGRRWREAVAHGDVAREIGAGEVGTGEVEKPIKLSTDNPAKF